MFPPLLKQWPTLILQDTNLVFKGCLVINEIPSLNMAKLSPLGISIGYNVFGAVFQQILRLETWGSVFLLKYFTLAYKKKHTHTHTHKKNWTNIFHENSNVIQKSFHLEQKYSIITLTLKWKHKVWGILPIHWYYFLSLFNLEKFRRQHYHRGNSF